MQGISKKEMEVVSDLEFKRKYYFKKEDIQDHFDSDKQMSNTLFNMRKKKRIIKLNRDKYFLIPIKARTGKWVDNPLIMTDEMMDGRDYFIGGWYAAKYWKLTDQVPMQVDIYTTRRQGRTTIMNKRFVFHRTTKKRTEEAATQRIAEHMFRIMPKEKVKKWMKSRS